MHKAHVQECSTVKISVFFLLSETVDSQVVHEHLLVNPTHVRSAYLNKELLVQNVIFDDRQNGVTNRRKRHDLESH